MQIITDNGVVFNFGTVIEKGIWANDPTMETYRITKDDGHYEYCVVWTFTVYTVDNIPEDMEPGKYSYTPETGFVLNPEPEITAEECLSIILGGDA